MRHPVCIADVPRNSILRVELLQWLEGNEVVPRELSPNALIYTGETIREDPLEVGIGARGWTISRPMPGHLLARLADAGCLSCTAIHHPPASPGDPRRCTLPVDADGTHPSHSSHHTDGLDPIPQILWSIDYLPGPIAPRPPRGPRNRAALRIGESDLVDLLRLPAGQRVIGFRDDPDTLSILVHLEGDGLPETAEGAEPYCINGGFASLPTVVTATGPHDIHAGVLAALDEPGHLEAWRSREARIRQLDRHQPVTVAGMPAGADVTCGHCCGDTCDEHAAWPCPDYLDAAAAVLVAAWLPPRTDPEAPVAAELPPAVITRKPS